MKIALKILITILIIIPIFLLSILLFSKGSIKYTETIEVEQPIELVNRLFANIYTMKEYMPGTKEIILTEGKDGEKGAKYKFIWDTGNEEMEIYGTLKSNNLPDSLTILYEMPGTLNIMTQKHERISGYKTLVINQQEFQFHGIMKIIAFFEPAGLNTDAFQTQTTIYLNAFKEFVESHKRKHSNIDA